MADPAPDEDDGVYFLCPMSTIARLEYLEAAHSELTTQYAELEQRDEEKQVELDAMTNALTRMSIILEKRKNVIKTFVPRVEDIILKGQTYNRLRDDLKDQIKILESVLTAKNEEIHFLNSIISAYEGAQTEDNSQMMQAVKDDYELFKKKLFHLQSEIIEKDHESSLLQSLNKKKSDKKIGEEKDAGEESNE